MEKALIKWGWIRAIVGFIGIYFVFSYASFLPMFLYETLHVNVGELGFYINRLLFVILTIFLLRKFIDRKSFTSLGFSIKQYLRDIYYSILAAFIIMFATFLIMYISGTIEIIAFNFQFNEISYWLIGFTVASALEELPLRGYALSNLMESINKYVAVSIIAVLFGLLHVNNANVNFIGLLNVSLLGVLIGIYYVYKKNLWVPIIFHMFWNYFQSIVFGYNVSGLDIGFSILDTKITGNELITGGDFGIEGSLVLTVVTIVAIIYLDKTLRKEKQKIDEENLLIGDVRYEN